MKLDRLLFPFAGGPPRELVGDSILLLLEPGQYSFCPEPVISQKCVEATIHPAAQSEITVGEKR